MKEEVLSALNSELAYQEAQTANPSRPDMVEKLSAGDIILAMEHNLARARELWYSGSAPHTEAAEYIRKVSALGVVFMSTFDAPERV